jgi:hypothetical protein
MQISINTEVLEALHTPATSASRLAGYVGDPDAGPGGTQ